MDTLLTVRSHSSITSIAAADWNACAGTLNPFLSHEFFRALEESGTACLATGWLPHHLTVGDPIVAIAPLYVKAHSEGEFVFDYAWAAAYERAGGSYYPKLQVAVPYTPVPGSRFLVKPGTSASVMHKVLRASIRQLVERANASSAHVTFCNADEFAAFDEPWLRRTGVQYHWSNRGYTTFDDFLGALVSRKRKAIRKERLTANADVRIEAVTGDALQSRHWDAFYRFYLDTSGRKWGRAALTRDFFARLGELMADRVVLMLAREPDGEYVAGALNLLGREALFGRNWGCLGYYPCLHFELCYYRAIEFAIERGLARVEAGAQGTHKIARGYEPVLTYSAHYLHDPRLRDAIRDYLEREREQVEHERQVLSEESPYRAAAASA